MRFFNKPQRCRFCLRLVILSLFCALPLAAPAEGGRFTDPDDGRFDVSEHLLQYSGVLPVPIIVTEPALDFGGGLAALWFSESIASAGSRGLAETGRQTPPAIGGLFGFKTGNGSWGGGGGFFAPLAGDRFRYLGGLGKVGLNLDYYSPTGRASGYSLEGAGIVQQILARVGDSDWFIGPRYVYVDADSRFSRERPREVTPRELETRIGMLTLVVDYDSRDNLFTPSRGTFMEAELATVREALGANVEYDYYAVRAFHYQPLGQSLVLGLRGDARSAGNEAPFFAQPYVTLRGIPAARYQDTRTAVVEAELRWNIDERWALVGFAGSGKAFGKRADWEKAETVNAGGIGFRYLIARKLGLYVGADIARGPEENAIYLQVGSAWR